MPQVDLATALHLLSPLIVKSLHIWAAIHNGPLSHINRFTVTSNTLPPFQVCQLLITQRTILQVVSETTSICTRPLPSSMGFVRSFVDFELHVWEDCIGMLRHCICDHPQIYTNC